MTKTRSAKRAVRLLAIRDALYGRPYTVQQLAVLLQVSNDVVRNDLVDLQLPPLSVPLQVDDRGRWYVGDPLHD